MFLKTLLRATTVLGLAASFALANADTYAVFYGINDYPESRDDNGKVVDVDLKGAVNDCNSIKVLLTEKYGVRPENVKTYFDKDANEKGFIEGLKWLIASAKAGDQVFFMYSGHGGQIPSQDPNEEDGKDEVIVLADNKLVTDNLFAELGKMLTDAGVSATFYFDSCFSGGMSRDAETRNKSLDIFRSKAHSRIAAAQTNAVKAIAKSKGAKAEKGDFAWLFAGQEDQPTKDISGLDGIEAHGLFTLFMSAVLSDHPDMTLEKAIETVVEVIAGVKDKEGKSRFSQKPRAEFSSMERAGKRLIPG
ncbi:MAG: caspase family protein [Fimbriimonadaceae bacterium]|nr:caspase family protein [Fimbriimonadaceae bacterium]